MGAARRSGFSLVETVISGAVLALLAGAVLSATSAAVDRRQDAAIRARGVQLAHDLLGEIRRKAYRDPDTTAADPIGPDDDEKSRSSFNDVDDYDGHEEDPVLDSSGVELPGFVGFARRTRVVLISTEDRLNPSPTDMGIKRVVVLVEYLGKPVAEVSGEFMLTTQGAWR